MDLLIEDGRTAEAKEYLWKMDKTENSMRTELYLGLIAKAECDLPNALEHCDRMTDEFDNRLSWSSKGDCLARLCRYGEAMTCYEKAHEMQPSPKYMDHPEAMSLIAEIQGDYEKATEMRNVAIKICETDRNITEGELVDFHKKEIVRLKKKSLK